MSPLREAPDSPGVILEFDRHDPRSSGKMLLREGDSLPPTPEGHTR